MIATSLRALADLVLPQSCVGCGAAGPSLCGSCRARLARTAAPAWPQPAPSGLPVPWAATSYDGEARAAILAHKERRRLDLAQPLGEALATAVAAALGSSSLRDAALVPVPTRAAATRRRGHEPTSRIASVAARVLCGRGYHVDVMRALRHGRGVADQAGLSAADRARNLAGALVVPSSLVRGVRGRTVIVVDDVITTGSTLAEAARALLAAGAAVPAVAAVAATRVRSGRTGNPPLVPSTSGSARVSLRSWHPSGLDGR